jgi:beta-glucanase (GH16 family)
VNPTNAAEIDIAEMLGETGPEVIQTNLHKYYPDDYRLDVKLNNGYQWSNWHTYGIEWSPSKIIWYLNGFPIRVFPNHGVVDPIKLIFAVGVRPGADLSSMNFPYKMYTDYVKVYKLKTDCNTALNLCNYSFTSYDNKVKKSITIGNGSCANTILTGQNITLRASEGILINGDFTVQSGAELYMDVNTCY